MRLGKIICLSLFLCIGALCKAAEEKSSALPRSTPEQPVAASGAWTAEGVYKAKLAFCETPFCVIITLMFSGDQLIYDAEYNVVRRGPKKLPQMIGHAE